jgi:tryptophanyl-tRNA synthetase
VWDFHKIYSDATTQKWVLEGCRSAGIGCLDCKKRVADVMVAEISAIRARAAEYQENRDLVRGIIAEGCEKARDVARQTLDEVHQAIGMNYR